MKRYGILSALAFVVLAGFAVWYGGLNQDEGWYLYAARLVEGGMMPYRDFAYTQGPLLPMVYSMFSPAWEHFGILGGRIVTMAIGVMGLLFATALARLLAAEGRKGPAGVITFMLLGCNLYHIYYLAIPKTYALASFFLLTGSFLLAFALVKCRVAAMRGLLLFGAGLCLAFAAGARISMGACLGVAGVALLAMCRRHGAAFVWLGLGGALGLFVVYAPFVTLPGFREAVAYHAARGGGHFDPMLTIGSLSRLVRWYLPIFVLGGMALFRTRALEAGAEPGAARHDVRAIVLWMFLAVFAVQILAPFPYEDYQVPIMALLAVAVAANISSVATVSASRVALLTLGMTWACSFGSPLLESWTTNGHDRFWPLKKAKPELAQLQDMAKVVEALDPGGDTLLTQDLYLAIETNRKVPQGLEMGPFSILSNDGWKQLLENANAPVAALSGYTFAINPPVCDERPIAEQMEFWGILKNRYDLVIKEDAFGQHATPLLILQRKSEGRTAK